MSEWRSMSEAGPETARHKLGRVLGVVHGQVRIIAWGKTSHLSWHGWRLADQGAEESDLCEPVAWMPLPEVPLHLRK